jgi:hypothetical protein
MAIINECHCLLGHPKEQKVNYTYSTDHSALGSHSNENGFILWKGDMRSQLFRRLFIGPLSPDIDAPNIINKSIILPFGYPYKPCSINPYLDDIEDKKCSISSWLIPMLYLLH